MNNKHVKDGLNRASRETQSKIEVRHHFKGTPRWLSGKDLPANAGDAGLTPRLGRSPGEGNGNPSVLAWKIPRTEEPSRLRSMSPRELNMTEHTYTRNQRNTKQN